MFNKKIAEEGNTYYCDNGEVYLVRHGSFIDWEKFLAEKPELKNGRFECRHTKVEDILKKTKIRKGIYRIDIHT